MNDLISVVMPVYNSQDYLTNSIVSVLRQTYNNIELIIVDDKSTDKSSKIIKEFASKDKRIVAVFLNNNQGLSNARNVGIGLAKGKYITFIDSDDCYGSNDVFEIIAKSFDDSKQLYVFPIKKIYLDENKPDYILEPKIDDKIIELDTVSAFRSAFDNYFKHSSCNKIFLLNIIKDNNIVFPLSIKLGEDTPFNAHYSLFVNRVQCISNVYYHYNIHNNSMCRTNYSNEYIEQVFEEIFNYYKGLLSKYFKEGKVYSYLNIMVFTKMFSPILKFKHYRASVKQVKMKLPKEYRNQCKKNLIKKYLSHLDYCFAKSFFSPIYRFTIFFVISINYYVKKFFARRKS